MNIDWGEFPKTTGFCNDPNAWRRTSQFGEWELTFNPEMESHGAAYVLFNIRLCLAGKGNSEEEAAKCFFQRLKKRMQVEQEILDKYEKELFKCK